MMSPFIPKSITNTSYDNAAEDLSICDMMNNLSLKDTPTEITDLPQEMITKIFKNLRSYDQKEARLVCHLFNATYLDLSHRRAKELFHVNKETNCLSEHKIVKISSPTIIQKDPLLFFRAVCDGVHKINATRPTKDRYQGSIIDLVMDKEKLITYLYSLTHLKPLRPQTSVHLNPPELSLEIEPLEL
jgi:hypothetical protein